MHPSCGLFNFENCFFTICTGLLHKSQGIEFLFKASINCSIGQISFLICRFKIDSNYIGAPPCIEVTIFQLNDNIDKQFLKDMVQKFGVIEELFIYYHPVSNKHLGKFCSCLVVIILPNVFIRNWAGGL